MKYLFPPTHFQSVCVFCPEMGLLYAAHCMNLKKKKIQSATIFWSEHLAHWHLKQLLIGFCHSSVGKECACNAGDPRFDSWVRKIPWRRDRLPTPVFLGFPCGSAGKESPCSVGDLGFIPGLGRSPGEGKGYSLQYSGLENFRDYTVHEVVKSQTGLSDFYFHFMYLWLFSTLFYSWSCSSSLFISSFCFSFCGL